MSQQDGNPVDAKNRRTRYTVLVYDAPSMDDVCIVFHNQAPFITADSEEALEYLQRLQLHYPDAEYRIATVSW